MIEIEELPEYTYNSFSHNSINDVLSNSLEFKKSTEFIKFFKFLARFDNYSFFNSTLIYIQNKNVAYYGSRYFWKKRFKRNINKNARSYLILTPYRPITIVYDIIDTNGEMSIDEILSIGLPFSPFKVNGEIDKRIYDNLFRNIGKWQIPIYFRPLTYFNAGHITNAISERLEICICSKKSKEENFSIIIHELAHLMLGHTQHLHIINIEKPHFKYELPQRSNLSRSEKELEAEIIALLICKRYGLETHAMEYIAIHIINNNSIKHFNYHTVIKVADKILRLFLG